MIISQPRYLPAINYINRLAKADKFVLLDTVQRQARGWENRNKLLVNGIPKWVSIPIDSSSRALIVDTEVKRNDWVEEHRKTVKDYYRNADHFNPDYVDLFYDRLKQPMDREDFKFTHVMMASFDAIRKIFGFESNIVLASELDPDRENWTKGPAELRRIAKEANSDLYISGPNGKDYGIEEVFEEWDMDIAYHNFRHPQYEQEGTEEFIPYMGFFDMLFNAGLEKTKRTIFNNLEIEEIQWKKE